MLTLEPRPLWDAFQALSAIPRKSGHEAAALAWFAGECRALGLELAQDAVGNLRVRKPAAPGREGATPVALQAHIDMVTEKNEATTHDFLTDPIRLRMVGDHLYATGTTLGADNGVGVCAALAVLRDRELAHGPLEVLITTDEEAGMTGASSLEPGWLRAKILLNLDSEEEGFVTVGCAGGMDTVLRRQPRWEAAPAASVAWRLVVSGLKGGHSGIDIQAGRANAIRLLGQTLAQLAEVEGLRVGRVAGGNLRNAIPREASAVLVGPASLGPRLEAAVAGASEHWRAAFGTFDPGVSITLAPAEPGPVLVDEDRRALVDLLLTLPHGVEAMSPDIAGLVLTSTNLAVLRSEPGGAFELALMTRSAMDASKLALAERIAAAGRRCGFAVEHRGHYPGWKPEPGAPIVALVAEVWKELSGKEQQVIAIHAGLECGLIGEKHPGMQMLSFGPDMWDVHTPDEHVSVPSVGRFYGLLRRVLERIP